MEEKTPGKFSVESRRNSFRYAIKGISTFFRTQPNAAIHGIAAMCVIAAGFYFEVTRLDWLFLVIAITMVFVAEMANTGLEFLTDLVSPGYNELAGKAKDVAAGAVLVAAVGAAIIGLIVFLPYILAIFSESPGLSAI